MPSSPKTSYPIVAGLAVSLAALAAIGWAQEAVAPVGNLVVNGDFEQVDAEGNPTNWAVRDWSTRQPGLPPQASGSVQRKGYVGPRCLVLTGQSFPVFFGYFTQPVTVGPRPPERLLLSLWYLTQQSPQADVSVNTFAENFTVAEWGTPVLTSEVLPLDDSPRWRCQTWEIICPPSAQQLVVMVRIHGAGTLRVDGVSLRPLPSEVGCEVLSAGVVTDLSGARECRFRLTNRASKPLELAANLEAGAPRAPRAATSQRLTLPATGTEDVALRYTYPVDTPHRLRLTLTSPQPGDVYFSEEWEVPGLVDGRLVEPAFRSSLLASLPGEEVRVAGRVNATPELRSKITLRALLMGASTAETEAELDSEGRYSLSLSARDMLAGNYGVQLQALVNGRAVGGTTIPVSKQAPREPEVAYDAKLRLHADGKPAFPLGIYYALEPADLAEVSAAGFNAVVLPARTASTATMDRMAALGLWALISSASMEDGFWAHITEKYSDRRELLGWYPLQRPDSTVPPAQPALMADLYGRLSRMDPAHPVCLALGSPSRMADYTGCSDVLMTWTAPRPVGDLRSVDMVIKYGLQLAAGRRPVWPVIQLAGAAYTEDRRLDPTGAGRPPTPEEFRCMVYLSLARGAQGVFCYALTSPSSGTQRAWDVRKDAAPLWEMAKVVAGQVKALSPALLDSEPISIESDVDPAQVAMRGMRYGDYGYIIVANPTAEAVPLRFSLPQTSARELSLGFAEGMVAAGADGAFADTIEPHGVRTYVVRWQ
ncbi:MAG: hypothetical protein HPY69_13555 [Armatimonadetes bacterium]|nr:hypothetical protein [Armatimonadota bacterium]